MKPVLCIEIKGEIVHRHVIEVRHSTLEARVASLEQQREVMSQEFDNLTREVQETKDETARLTAASAVYEAAFVDLKAQVAAMGTAPTPAQLTALSQTLDQAQADSAAARAKVDAAISGTATPPPPAGGDTTGQV